MNSKEKRTGTVTEILPSGKVNVDFDGKILMCYISGKMNLHKIRVMLGDKVEAEIDDYGGQGTHRIIKRY